MTFDSDEGAIALLEKHKWTMTKDFNWFSPKPYGECTHEEKCAIIYLIDEHDFNYGGHIG